MQVTKFWRCEERGRCKGRLHVNGTKKVVVGQHTHEPYPCRVEAATALTRMRKRARETEESTSVVLSVGTQDVCEASQGALPAVSSMKRTVQRTRQRCKKTPPCPKSLTELQIPSEYASYCPSSGVTEDFLLLDSGPSGEDRILIFGRRRF